MAEDVSCVREFYVVGVGGGFRAAQALFPDLDGSYKFGFSYALTVTSAALCTLIGLHLVYQRTDWKVRLTASCN